MTDPHPGPLNSQQIAQKWERYGAEKAAQPAARTLALSIMAGLFIGMGCMFYEIVLSDWQGAYGPGMIMGGFAFLIGLAAIIVAGGELFTGNTMMSIAWWQRRITTTEMLRSWAIVLGGNIVGILLIASLAFWSGHWQANGGQVGLKALSIGYSKATLSYEMAFARGILCNLYICLAVWMYHAGRSISDKLLAIILPIFAFVASGSEHIVANWFYGPYALMLKGTALAHQMEPVKLATLTMPNFLTRQIFVLLGNIVGGGLFFAGPYWFAWLRGEAPVPASVTDVKVGSRSKLPL